MENKIVKCGKLNISNSSSFTLIAGPCQLENEKHAVDVASKLKEIAKKLQLRFIPQLNFSFDNAFEYANKINKILKEPKVLKDL